MALDSKSLLFDASAIEDIIRDVQDAPTTAITRDGQDRITEIAHTYSDRVITYTFNWAAATGAELTDYTKTVTIL